MRPERFSCTFSVKKEKKECLQGALPPQGVDNFLWKTFALSLHLPIIPDFFLIFKGFSRNKFSCREKKTVDNFFRYLLWCPAGFPTRNGRRRK